MSQQVAQIILAVIKAVTICNCFPFPIKAVIRKAKYLQINHFQSFISSFPSFGRGFDSHRPLIDDSIAFMRLSR
jgi:hypothetical protein